MCQQQRETQVTAQQYADDWSYSRAGIMAKIIAKSSIEGVRKMRDLQMRQWYDGRARAAALIYPCVETIASANETRFLTGEYAQRTGWML